MKEPPHQVRIGGELADDDGVELDLGPLAPGEAWWDKALPPCPDCGGTVLWWEAGYVPGTRKCISTDAKEGCGSMFSVKVTPEGRVILRRERFY